MWYKRNTYPKSIKKTWSRNPRKGQRVEVMYAGSVRDDVWWDGDKFVDKKNKEVHNIVAWRSYKS